MSVHLYAVRFGDAVKVGRTMDLRQRYSAYRRDARLANVEFTPLLELPKHVEADMNERTVLNRFRPAGQKSEYLRDVDADEVVAFMRTLPCTPPTAPREVTRWVPRADAALMLRVNVLTVDRYAKAGYLRIHKNEITKRVSYALEDIAALGGQPHLAEQDN